jgi:hypothetical protein
MTRRCALLSTLCLMAWTHAARADFAAQLVCSDYTNNGSSCQTCSAGYANDGVAMADATVSVDLSVKSNGLVEGCGNGLSDAITATASGSVTVRVVGDGPGPIPVNIAVNASPSGKKPLCRGSAVGSANGKSVQNSDEVSDTIHLLVAPGDVIGVSAGATVT